MFCAKTHCLGLETGSPFLRETFVSEKCRGRWTCSSRSCVRCDFHYILQVCFTSYTTNNAPPMYSGGCASKQFLLWHSGSRSITMRADTSLHTVSLCIDGCEWSTDMRRSERGPNLFDITTVIFVMKLLSCFLALQPMSPLERWTPQSRRCDFG